MADPANPLLAANDPRFAGQDLNALLRGLPELTAWERIQSSARDVRRALSIPSSHINWAMGYPSRVRARAVADPEVEPYHPEAVDALMPTAERINALGQYNPSGRESTNVEDRRPQSIWSYW